MRGRAEGRGRDGYETETLRGWRWMIADGGGCLLMEDQSGSYVMGVVALQMGGPY